MARKYWLLTLGAMGACGLGIVGLCAAAIFDVPCVATGISHGMWVDECPAGTPRLWVEANATGLLRGEDGALRLSIRAQYALERYRVGEATGATVNRGFTTEVALLDADEVAMDGVMVGAFERSGPDHIAKLGLPDVPDGDYTLRITVDAGFDTETVDVPLALYTPAIAFVQTDRSLYQPGQDVLLRGVLLERTGLEPIDDRPARWRISGPDGELMVEDDRAGAFGVLDSSFPLDRFATHGTYTARLESGSASDEITFDVRPFKLPRLSSDITADARWYGIGDTVRLTGRATYLSGAPVSEAPVSVRMVPSEGEWPMPIAWEEPMEVQTDAQGRWSVEVGEVPADLVGVTRFRALATATESGGESVTGSTQVVVSHDDLVVSALTELGNGLVADANNRLWLRGATPDGVPLPGVTLTVSNPWDSDSEPKTAVADADGVAAVQIDPGTPVSVTQPGQPTRVRPPVQRLPELTGAEVLQRGRISMDERRVLDRLNDRLATCQWAVDAREDVHVAVRIDASGRPTRVVSTESTPASTCVAAAVQTARFEPGEVRVMRTDWRLHSASGPSLTADVETARQTEAAAVHGAIRDAMHDARLRCLPQASGLRDGLVIEGTWFVEDGQATVQWDSLGAAGTGRMPSATRACIEGTLRGLQLSLPERAGVLGSARVVLRVPSERDTTQPGRPTYTTGYELQVAAQADDEAIGETRVVLEPGVVPPLRVRVTPSIAAPGETVSVSMVRGPGFRGTLPRELVWYRGTVEVGRSPVDEDTRTATFTIPDDARDFLHTTVSSTRGLVFVDDGEPLSVSVTSDRGVYRPGETATLTVTTRAGDSPVAAAVGLSGVDESLGQLSPLTAPDAMSRVTVRATSESPAFDHFDAAALVMGRIRGDNAAQAAMTTVSTVPMDAAGDERVSGYGTANVDAAEAILTAFYRGRTHLAERVRDWEASADEGVVLMPEDVARLWREVLEQARRDGEPVADIFGRDLDLGRLPDDLLDELDPRGLVRDATRLPEDVIDWKRWVAREVR